MRRQPRNGPIGYLIIGSTASPSPRGTHDVCTLAAAPHRTKQEFVYRTLRDAILRCELQPGERLVIDDLARRLNVSIIPVREALQLLQAESLVQVVPHVGTSVTPVSRDSSSMCSSSSKASRCRRRASSPNADAPPTSRPRGQVDAMEAALAANDREDGRR